MKRTGLTDKQMNALRVRDNGVCVLTGADTGRLVPQHRRNRGSGSGTTGMVATQEGRRYIGIDLSVQYLELSLRTRFQQPVLDMTGGA